MATKSLRIISSRKSKKFSDNFQLNVKFDPELLNYDVETEIVIENLDNLTTLFNNQDQDQDGLVSFKELKELFGKFETLTTNEENKVKKIYNSSTTKENPFVDFDTFISIYKTVLRDRKLEEEAKQVLEAFNTFDRDKNGYISIDEMKHILDIVDEDAKLTEHEIEEIFKEADLNQDGKLDYQEFVQFWRTNFIDI